MTAMHTFGRAALGGAIIATLCFFPLLNGLASEPVWLHWTIFDSLETVASWFVTATAIGVTLWLPARWLSRRSMDAIGLFWLLLGALFTVGGVVKLGPVMGVIGAHRTVGPWVIGCIAIMLATVGLLAVRHPGNGTRTRIQRLTALLWPLILVFAFHLVHAPSLAAEQKSVYSPATADASGQLPRLARTESVRASGIRTVVLLFDELSPDYLYGERSVNTSALPAIRHVLATGTIYRDAQLNGGETRYAIPALFGATQAAPQGLTQALSDRGLSVRVWGWYHDYCGGLGRGAEVCHSNSIYNARTLDKEVSLLDPWWTNLNLLPADLPFGLLKDRTAIALHRRTLEAARSWLRKQLADPHADFIYAHINVPHLPLLAADPATAKPFVMSEKGYVQQFFWVDSVLADVLANHLRPTQLIVVSDHNARPLFPKSQHDHVVLLAMEPAGRRRDDTRRVDAAEVIDLLSLSPDERGGASTDIGH